MLLAHHVQFQKFYNQESNINSVTNLEKKLNSNIRKIQAFFHPNQVNNLKRRVDHENGTSEKQTWLALADLYNSTDPDKGVVFDSALQTDENDHLIDNPGYEHINLTNFTMTPIGGNKEIKKYMAGLFKLRSEEIKKMIGISGTHDNDPMSYVNRTKARVPGGGGFH
jgi:hypothetical protein